MSWFVDNNITKAMLGVRGVGATARVGGVTREVRVELDPMRLQALNATAADISRQLRQVQQEASGGRTDLGGAEQSVRTIATVRSAEELARMEIVLGDGRRIRLDQVATVSDTVGEKRSAALLNGEPVVGFEVTRSRGAGEIEVAAGVRAELEKLKAAHPDITITEAFNFVDPVQEGYDGSMLLMYEGAVLAVLVVWLFLRDWRATFVAATALPLSIIPTFGAMYLMGFTVNVVTLLSLSLVVGILVDDAIVEIENIMRHLRMGKTPFQAAMEAADEIGLAVIATTFTLIAVFLPTAFMSGVPGKFFVQFGWTAAIAVFFSLVVARMLTPMMAAYLLHKPKKAHKEPGWLSRYMGWAQVVPEAPRQDHAGGGRLHGRLADAGAAAAHRLHPAGRPVADAGVDLAAAGQHLRADLRCRRTGARDGPEEPERQAGLHRHRRWQCRRRPLRAAGRGRGAHRHADDQHDAAPAAQGPEQAGHRERTAHRAASTCPAHVSRSASAARRRSTCWCWPARTAACWPNTRARWKRSCAPSPASATSPPPPAWCARS